MCSCVAAVEASVVDEIDGGGCCAVEEVLLVVFMVVLLLQLFLHQLVALPQRRVLDSFNLPTQLQHVTRSYGMVLIYLQLVFVPTGVN